LNGNHESFLKVDDPALVLGAWKPAEDGNGTILRFIDLGGATRTVTVEAPLFDLQKAFQTDAVERNQTPLSLSGSHAFQFAVHPHEIVTVRLIGKDAMQAQMQ
jgi:alpha-mannosidase